MITDAVVIGAVEAAVFWEDDEVRAFRLGSNAGELIDCSREIGWLLTIGAEKRRLPQPPRDLTQLGTELRLWSARQRALTMMLSGMDPQLTAQTRTTCILAADRCMRSASAHAFSRARLLGCPLPSEADLDGALRLAFEANARRAATLYGDLNKAAPHIATVRQLLEKLLRYDFDGDVDPEHALRAVVDSGIVADALEAALGRDKAALNDLVFRYKDHHDIVQALPRAVHFLTKFVGAVRGFFETREAAVSSVVVPEVEETLDAREDPIGSAIEEWKNELASLSKRQRRQARTSYSDEVRERIDRQKGFIVESLDRGRAGQAERAILDLIRSQRRDSSLEQVCKSLCDLGASATRFRQFELAQRLYRAAAIANERDAVPATGYAETLRQMGRLDDALEAYGEAKVASPHNVYAATGYAETLRQMGHLDDALAAYEEAKAAFSHEPVPATGYAETLRQMGRLDDALEVYGEAKVAFPHEPVPANGYAETLRQMGRLDDALEAYGGAKVPFPNNVYAANGYAETLRQMGRLHDALAAYEEAKAAFSHEPVPATGYAETLRQMGHLDDALAAYGEAKVAFPRDVYAATGYAETLRELDRLQLAEDEFRSVLNRFPNERVARNALACLMIDTGRTADGRVLVEVEKPRTEQDWRDYHVAAMALLKEGNYAEAERRFRKGADSAPFFGAKGVFRTSLAYVKLRQQQYEEVSELVDRDNVLEFPLPAAAVINAHAKAELHQLEQAEQSLLKAERSRSATVIRLGEYLRKRYSLGAGAGHVTIPAEVDLDEVIAKEEFNLTLRPAA